MERHAPGYSSINKQMKKVIRNELRDYNTHFIQQAIKDSHNTITLRSSKTARGNQVIQKTRNEQGTVVYEKKKVAAILQVYSKEMLELGYSKDNKEEMPETAAY